MLMPKPFTFLAGSGKDPKSVGQRSECQRLWLRPVIRTSVLSVLSLSQWRPIQFHTTERQLYKEETSLGALFSLKSSRVSYA